ncbi:MAG: protein-L-isoaspartate(D-aspartate) O-methyltransferase [Acidobacteriota bacterium]|nr:MAG: protein-L-isoaspartate(D-aspartate) O-methyltransferase [Acidobacteriota bacterium]
MARRLVDHYLIRDERVLEAMASIPRHEFVPDALRSQAYRDNALPLSSGQTVSQPFIVARMTELLELSGNERVLEIGAGSGYQTAVLCRLAGKIFAIERIRELADKAEARLMSLGFENFVMKCGDGTLGWPEYGPYDAIIAAAGGPEIPQPLVEQLAAGGRLVVPVGPSQTEQTLIRIRRTATGKKKEDHGRCAFVPLIGEHGWNQEKEA